MRRVADRKSPLSGRFVPAVVLLVLFNSTLLLCDVAKPTPSTREQDWASVLDRALAAPIRLTDVSDLRWYACAAGLVCLLFVFALRRGRGEAAAANDLRGGGSWAKRFGPEALAGLTVVCAVASAFFNDTWELSRGYIFFLCMGLGWMLALARATSWENIGGILKCVFTVILVGAVLSLWHLYAMGPRFFQLPVGPVTVTACFGAFWSVFGAVWLAERWFGGGEVAKSGALGSLAAVIVVVLSWWLLYEARRRGAILGFLASFALIGAVVVWVRRPSRVWRGAVVGFAVLALVGAVAFVWQQSKSSQRVTSIPLKVRYTYYETMARMLPATPLLGFGPDMFICEMTNKLAPVRSQMPHILHGGVDADAHNEWFQAVFELGIPGGLAYSAIPLLIISMCLRTWASSQDAARRRVVLALAAAIICLYVNELSSVNLRGATVIPWYWTMLGAALGVCRSSEAGNRESERASAPGALGRGTAAVLGFLIIWFCSADISRAQQHGIGRSNMYTDPQRAVTALDNARGRFGTSRWLSLHNYRGTALTNLWLQLQQGGPSQAATTQASPMDEREKTLAAQTEAEWQKLYARAPAYLKTGFQLAQAQHLAGDTARAVSTLRQYLDEVYPYEKNSNLLLIEIGELSFEEALQRLLCAIKWERWEQDTLTIAQQLMQTPSIAAAWPARVAGAIEDVGRGDEDTWKDRLACEVLRVEAFRRIFTGDLAGAEEMQMRAARAMEKLAELDSRFRRPAAAETDAWYLAARFIFDLSPTNYVEASRRSLKAEVFAMRDAVKEYVPDPVLGAPHVGGVIIPVNPPETLRDLWRFSAQMLMATKGDPKQITLRIGWSLPPERQSPSDVKAELAILAAEMVKRFEGVPEFQRPESYPRLVEFARAAGK